MYLRWFIFAPISFLFNIFVMLTSPIWALWAAVFNLDSLPGPFAWVHTHDETIYGNHVYGEKPKKVIDRFKRAVKWLCRNPGYTFDAKVLGFSGEDLKFLKTETKGTFDIGGNAYRYDVMEAGGKKYFSYRRDIKIGKHRYIKLWFGWQYVTQAGWHIIKFEFNPFRTIK